MKKLFFASLLISIFTNAQQTTYSDAEIRAVAGNRWEYLIVGTDISEGYTNVQSLLNKMGFSPIINPKDREKIMWVHSNQTNGKIKVYTREKTTKKIMIKDIPFYYVKSLDIYGDKLSIIKFYINFWSKALNFRDVKEGETVSVRFLSDVATLTVNKDNTAIIKVRSAKER